MLLEQIKARHKVFCYRKKPDTKAAYLLEEGPSSLFPIYISLSTWELSPISQTGRARTEQKTGDLKTTFRLKEKSPYKLEKPYTFSTSIWKNPNFPVFLGYGDIGRTGYSGKTESTKDLLIFFTSDNLEEVHIHLFTGLVDYKNEAFKYLQNYIKQQKP